MTKTIERWPTLTLVLAIALSPMLAAAPRVDLIVPAAHTLPVKHMAADPGGQWVATAAGLAGGVIIWDARTGDFLRQFDSPAVHGLSPSPDGKQLAVRLLSRTMVLDIGSGRDVSLDYGLGHQDRFMTWSPDGAFVLIGRNLTLVRRDLRSRQDRLLLEISEPEFVSNAAVGPNSSKVVAVTSKRVLAGEITLPLEVVATGAYSITATPKAPVFGLVENTSLPPQLAEGPERSVQWRQWDQPGRTFRRTTCGSECEHVSASRDGEMVLVGAPFGSTRLLELTTGKSRGEFSPSAGDSTLLSEALGSIQRLAVSASVFLPDRARAFVGTMSGAVYSFDLQNLSSRLLTTTDRSGLAGASFTASGGLAASGFYTSTTGSNTGQQGIWIWSANEGVDTFRLNSIGVDEAFSQAILSASGRYVVVQSESRIMLYDRTSGKWPLTVSPGGTVAAKMSPDDQWLAYLSDGGNQNDASYLRIQSIDKKTSSLDIELGNHHEGEIYFSRDSRSVAFLELGASFSEMLTAPGRGERLITAGRLRVWDVGNGKVLADHSGVVPIGFAFLDNGSGFIIEKVNQDGPQIYVERFASSKPKIFPAGCGGAFAVVPGNTHYACYDSARLTVRLRSLETNELVSTSDTLSESITSIAFSEDGKVLLARGTGGSLFLLDGATAEVLVSISLLNAGAQWVAWSPDGLFDAAEATWSQLRWRLEGNTFRTVPVEMFVQDFYRPRLVTRVLREGRLKSSGISIDASQLQVRPVVTLLADGDGRNAHARLFVSGSAVHELRLFRNGVMVKRWIAEPGRPLPTNLDFRLRLSAGHNSISAYGFSQEGLKSETVLVHLSGPTADPFSKLFVLAVGVDDYRSPDSNLRYAVADAQRIAKSFEGNASSFQHRDLKVLLNREATRERILSELRRISVLSGPDDTVVVFFAGHGRSDGDKFVLIPADADNLISESDLLTAFEPIDARALALVLDACSSGLVLSNDESRFGPLHTWSLGQLAYAKGMAILAATQSHQQAFESNHLGHGLLTHALCLDGIESRKADIRPRDGSIDLRELFQFATVRVPELDGMRSRLLVPGSDTRSANSARQQPTYLIPPALIQSPLVLSAYPLRKFSFDLVPGSRFVAEERVERRFELAGQVHQQSIRFATELRVERRGALYYLHQRATALESTRNGRRLIDPLRAILVHLPVILVLDRFGELQGIEGLEGFEKARADTEREGADPAVTGNLSKEFFMLYLSQRWAALSPGLYGAIAEPGEKLEQLTRAPLSTGPMDSGSDWEVVGDADCPSNDCTRIMSSTVADAAPLITALGGFDGQLEATEKLTITAEMVVSRGTGLSWESRQSKRGIFRLRAIGEFSVFDVITYRLSMADRR